MSSKNKNTQLVSSGRKKAYTHGVVNPVIQRASTIVFDSVSELKEAAKTRGDKTLFYGRKKIFEVLSWSKKCLVGKLKKLKLTFRFSLRRISW